MSNITLLPHQVDVINQTKDMNKVAYYLDWYGARQDFCWKWENATTQ